MNKELCSANVPYGINPSFAIEIVANGVIVRAHNNGQTYVFDSLDSAFAFIKGE